MNDNDRRPAERPDREDSTSSGLLADVRAGIPDGWAEMVRLYAPLVLWHCRRGFPPERPGLCGRRAPLPRLSGVPGQDAADVVQEVFLTVSQKIKTFAKDGKPAAFRRLPVRHHTLESARVLGGAIGLAPCEPLERKFD